MKSVDHEHAVRMHSATCGFSNDPNLCPEHRSLPWDRWAAAALKVADAELAESRAEVERWKRKAERYRTECNNMLDDHHETSDALVEMIGRVEAAEAEAKRLRTFASELGNLGEQMSLKLDEARSWEQMLADPREQFDLKGDMLAVVWRNADGSTIPVKDVPTGTPTFASHQEVIDARIEGRM